jgi:hypothetical protein
VGALLPGMLGARKRQTRVYHRPAGVPVARLHGTYASRGYDPGRQSDGMSQNAQDTTTL